MDHAEPTTLNEEGARSHNDLHDFLEILDYVPAVVAVIDRNHYIQFINQYFEAMLPENVGLRFVGRSLETLFGAEVYAAARGKLELCFKGERQVLLTSISFHGSPDRVLDWVFIPYQPDATGVNCVIAFANDLTELKLMEQRLKDGEAHYRSLVESSLDLIFTVDTEGLIQFANPAATPVFTPGKNILFIVYREDLECTRDALDQLAKGTRVRDLEIRVAGPEGKLRYLNLIATPVPTGAVERHSMVIARDVTHEKKFEQLARDAGLTPRELDVVRLIAQGFTNLNIASRLDIQESTVKFHINRIFRKTNTQSRTELVSILH